MKIPSLKMKVGRALGFVNNDPSQDQPIVLQTTDREVSMGSMTHSSFP
jgi:hypothetical protein